MARNVDGEFEVLLGNKQLLSVFFIVLILMAVFFTMGYVLGRDSASRGSFAKPQAATPAAVPQSESSGLPDSSPDAETAPALPPLDASGRLMTQPQQQLPTAEPARPAPPPTSAKQSLVTPEAGQVFLQAMATGKRPDADLVASVLRKKGFAVVIAPGPTDGVFRVLVGPFNDDQAQRQARTDLEAAGFKPFARRY